MTITKVVFEGGSMDTKSVTGEQCGKFQQFFMPDTAARVGKDWYRPILPLKDGILTMRYAGSDKHPTDPIGHSIN